MCESVASTDEIMDDVKRNCFTKRGEILKKILIAIMT
jgi:hypothetical protein